MEECEIASHPWPCRSDRMHVLQGTLVLEVRKGRAPMCGPWWGTPHWHIYIHISMEPSGFCIVWLWAWVLSSQQSMAFGLSGSWETSMITEKWLLFTCQHKTTLAIGLDAFGCRWANRVSRSSSPSTQSATKWPMSLLAFVLFSRHVSLLIYITCWNDSTLCIQNLLWRSLTTQLISQGRP